MSRCCWIAAAAISMACRGGQTPEVGPPTSAGSAAPTKAFTPPPLPSCEQVPFAESSTVPEASGAAWLSDGNLLVVSDSGNDGAYVVLNPETGSEVSAGRLPIGDGKDDIEGLAMRGEQLIGVSSSGWIRAWKRSAAGWELVDGPYPLGRIDLPDKKKAALDDPGMVCSETTTNCGRDYEGICLPLVASGPCVGFVASKTDGRLYCLHDKDGELQVDQAISIPIAKSGAIADCAFSDRGELFVGSNLFDAGNVYRVSNWQQPAKAVVEKVGALGIGFPETIAVRGGMIYRLSDTGSAPSLMTKYRCK